MTEQTLQRQNEGKSLGGRPDKISDWHVKRAKEYASGAWSKDGSVVPTLEGMAKYLDLSRQSLYEASELSYTVEQMQRDQASIVLNRGLTGEFNANIAKLILSAKHGYREQSEQLNVNVELTTNSQNATDTATGFADYLKQSTVQPTTPEANLTLPQPTDTQDPTE